MLCPECGEDTNPTLKFCQFCNKPLEFDVERLGAALNYESEDVIKERLERKARGYLYLAVYVLVVVIIVRVLIIETVKTEHGPSYAAPKSLVNQFKPPYELPSETEVLELPK